MGHSLTATEKQLIDTSHRIATVARRAGVPIQELGVATGFCDVRLYRGRDTDWVLAPVELDPQANRGVTIPRTKHNDLRKLVDAGIDLPYLYIAHEVPRATALAVVPGLAAVPDTAKALASVGPGALIAAPSFVPIPASMVAKLVPPPPAPVRSTRVAAGLGRIAGATVDVSARVASKALRGAALVGSAPAAAVAALALLDPVVFGAIGPGGRFVPGQPAAYFALIRWDW